VNGTEHVIVGKEVVKAQILDRCPDPPNSGRIPSKLGLRIDNANLHRSTPSAATVAAQRRVQPIRHVNTGPDHA
jgi:hypothetical protein